MPQVRMCLRIMEEDEIDGWYEDEKQKAIDEYIKEIEENKNKELAQKKI